ncbi:MAG TPA: hypothetical protein VEL07_05085 [Planctomycetota bacterium]|nr:hypothetical protein [Planctomycetota bacterium]
MRITLVLAIPLLALAGCGNHRGLPGHGGGKRFDEEQRIVAASIRRSVADMDLSRLPPARVQVVVSGIAHQGAGSDRYPGPTALNLGLSNRRDETTTLGQDAAAVGGGGPWNPDWRQLSETSSVGPSASMSVRLEHEYTACQYMPWTDADLIYLDQVLRMRLLHLGIVPTDHEPELCLRVLVDVLGINRSRDDWLLFTRDVLQASCELSWYVTAAADQKVVQGAERTGATATYSQSGWLLFSGLSRGRSLAPNVSPELELVPSPPVARADARPPRQERRPH